MSTYRSVSIGPRARRGGESVCPVVLLAVVALLGSACGRGSTDAAESGASVLLITLQGWSASVAPPLSDEALDGLVRYGDVMTTSPQLRPAAASLLSGLGADRHGAEDDHVGVLSPEVGTLAETLGGRGWSTAAFLASPVLARRSGLDRGFELYDVPPGATVIGPRRFFPVSRTPEAVAERAAEWLGAQDGRYFAWVHLVGPGPGVLYGDSASPAAEQPRVSWSAAVETILAALRARADAGATAVVLGGLIGPPTAGDPERSGYFLVPEVLRVPLWLRAANGAATPDPTLPLWTPDVTTWVLEQAGVDVRLGEGQSPTDPDRARFAWTWRGAREMGWYPETAVVRAGRLVCREGRNGATRVFDWASGGAGQDEADPETLALLDSRATPEEARLSPVRQLPAELAAELESLGVTVPAEAAAARVAPRAVRLQSLAKVFEGRNVIAFGGPRPRALEAYRFALTIDPGNRGARQDLAETLSVNRTERARKHVDEILADDPYNADGWHAYGHIAHKEKTYALADALWRVTALLRPDDGDLYYDLACTKSLLGDLDASVDYLERAWAAGFRSVDYIEADPDLRNLREDERFSRFMSGVVR